MLRRALSGSKSRGSPSDEDGSNLEQGRAEPWRGASEIDEFRRCPAGDEVYHLRWYLLLAQPLGELVHAPALIAHFEVDPEPGCHDRGRVDVVVDLESSGEDIEKVQGLSAVLHDTRGVLLHADDQPHLAVSLLRHVAREIGGLTRRCMVADAAIDVPARFAFATMLDLDLDRREEDRDGARRQKGLDQDLGRRECAEND